MTTRSATSSGGINRRALLTGIGAGALVTGLGVGATSAVAAPTANNSRAEQVLAIADSQVGETGESGGYSKFNYGRNWNSPMRGDHHVAWCALFLSWCFDQEWGETQTNRAIGYQGNKVFPAGWDATWLWRDHLRNNGQWVGWDNAEPGDLVFFKFGDNGNATDHVAMVSDPHSTNTYEMIEGNIREDSDWVVNYRERTRDSSLVAVYRPLWDVFD